MPTRRGRYAGARRGHNADSATSSSQTVVKSKTRSKSKAKKPMELYEVYDLRSRQRVKVDPITVQVRKTANGRLQMVGSHNGHKVYKFINEDTARKLRA